MTAALLTVLGVGRYERVRYHLAAEPGRWHETRYAPVATAALLGGMGEAVLFLTEEARQMHGDACGAELEALGIRARAVPIPKGASAEELWHVFERIVDAVGAGAELLVDVTHSFRHLPFVLFGSLTYLTALRKVGVRGVYYGAYEARVDDAVPIFDLGPLVQLTLWYHALRTFSEMGLTRHLALLLRAEAKAIFPRQGPVPELNALRGALENLAWMIPTGLPIEAGRAAHRGLTALRALREGAGPSAVSRTLLDPLADALEPVSLPVEVADKREVVLAEDELRRELCLARWLCARGQWDRALLLLREWIINRCLFAGESWRGRWLEYDAARQPMERALNALAERQRSAPPGSPERERRLPSLWQEIAQARNTLAHMAFRPEWAKNYGAKVEAWLEECEACSGDETFWRTAPPGGAGRVLVTALGKSPGVLFTALRRLAPDAALVVTSPEAEVFLAEACRVAEWPADRAEPFVVADAHRCFGEARRLLDWARPRLLEAGEVLVNVTGGTTAMQYLAERVAEEAARLGVPTRRYALVDRRDPEEQRRVPYVVGEAVPLEDGERSHDG